MTATIAILAPGAMGSAIGRRLTDHGAKVLTMLQGRGPSSVARAEAAGMLSATAAAVAEADLILSIVPPAEALSVAQSLLAPLRQSRRKPAFVDGNAISPATMRHVAEVLEGSGVSVLDGCIIGSPPVPGRAGPTFYVSGTGAGECCALLQPLGLDMRMIAGPVGAASALKMSYAGITKGLTALAATMLLAAQRESCAEALRAELAASQPQLLARFEKALPDMLPKAYRWVAEMEEIAAFLGPDDPGAAIYRGAAGVFARISGDLDQNQPVAQAFERFFKS